MRSSIAIASGLLAVAYAKTTTITDTVDVTITSCEPTVTNCPYKPTHTWEDWESTTTSTPVDPVSVSTYSWGDWEKTSSIPVDPISTATGDHTWADWDKATTVTPVTTVTPISSVPGCGVYTATAPPAWFSYLPADVHSSIAAKWSGAPPADWCYYTYSASSLITSTPVAPVTSGPSSWPVAPISTSVKPAPATYTGAANSNTGSFALAGLAAAAALVLA